MQEQTRHREHRLESATPLGTDPVCGMKVPVASAYRHAMNGSESVFCSARCRDRFASDPSKYSAEKHEPSVSRPKTPPSAKAQSTPAYTCPMHPEVRADHPGSCSKCGMALELVSPGPPAKAEWVCPMHGRRLLGYDALPPEARYTRGEALDAALRQLVAEKPRLTDRAGLEEPELSALVVVPVADRAALAHRFALTLDALPYVVDVDDATLGVVRVNIDRRFNRSPVAVSVVADVREQIAPDPISAE